MGLLGLQVGQRPGEGRQVMALPLHRQGKGVGHVAPAFRTRVVDHPGIHGAELFGLPFRNRPQVLNGAADFAGDTEVVHAVDVLGPGDFLEYLGHLRVSLFQGAVSVGAVFQVSHRLADDGVPQVLVGPGQLRRFGSHANYPFFMLRSWWPAGSHSNIITWPAKRGALSSASRPGSG